MLIAMLALRNVLLGVGYSDGASAFASWSFGCFPVPEHGDAVPLVIRMGERGDRFGLERFRAFERGVEQLLPTDEYPSLEEELQFEICVIVIGGEVQLFCGSTSWQSLALAV